MNLLSFKIYRNRGTNETRQIIPSCSLLKAIAVKTADISGQIKVNNLPPKFFHSLPNLCAKYYNKGG